MTLQVGDIIEWEYNGTPRGCNVVKALDAKYGKRVVYLEGYEGFILPKQVTKVHPKLRNARFWIWENDDWVKVTVKVHQQLVWYQGGPTHEGWRSKRVVFTHVGDVIERETTSDGCDCDGRLTRTHTEICKIENLKLDEPYREEGSNDWVPPGVPQWEKESSFQRDYEAERAGY